MSVEGDTTMLYYSIDHPDLDNNFTVTVVPINGAGPGEDAIKFIQIRIPVIMTTTNKGKFIPIEFAVTNLFNLCQYMHVH